MIDVVTYKDVQHFTYSQKMQAALGSLSFLDTSELFEKRNSNHLCLSSIFDIDEVPFKKKEDLKELVHTISNYVHSGNKKKEIIKELVRCYRVTEIKYMHPVSKTSIEHIVTYSNFASRSLWGTLRNHMNKVHFLTGYPNITDEIYSYVVKGASSHLFSNYERKNFNLEKDYDLGNFTIEKNARFLNSPEVILNITINYKLSEVGLVQI